MAVYKKKNGQMVPVDSGGSGGGHTIVDSAGTEYPNRSKLEFIGAEITDDDTNDKTIVQLLGLSIVNGQVAQTITTS